jgi:hypothetical protein
MFQILMRNLCTTAAACRQWLDNPMPAIARPVPKRFLATAFATNHS